MNSIVSQPALWASGHGNGHSSPAMSAIVIVVGVIVGLFIVTMLIRNRNR